MHAAMLADDPPLALQGFQNVLEQCLARIECTQQYPNELEALDLLLQSRLGMTVPVAKVKSTLAAILTAEQPRLDELRLATGLAELLQKHKELPEGINGALREKFDQIPPSRRLGLRYLLARLDYLMFSAPHDQEIAELENQIEARRDDSQRQLEERKASA